jgi:hypothetical protein
MEAAGGTTVEEDIVDIAVDIARVVEVGTEDGPRGIMEGGQAGGLCMIHM